MPTFNSLCVIYIALIVDIVHAVPTVQRINAHSKLSQMVYFEPAEEKKIQYYVQDTVIYRCGFVSF
jgi:hypothetical protein